MLSSLLLTEHRLTDNTPWNKHNNYSISMLFPVATSDHINFVYTMPHICMHKEIVNTCVNQHMHSWLRIFACPITFSTQWTTKARTLAILHVITSPAMLLSLHAIFIAIKQVSTTTYNNFDSSNKTYGSCQRSIESSCQTELVWSRDCWWVAN